MKYKYSIYFGTDLKVLLNPGHLDEPDLTQQVTRVAQNDKHGHDAVLQGILALFELCSAAAKYSGVRVLNMLLSTQIVEQAGSPSVGRTLATQ